MFERSGATKASRAKTPCRRKRIIKWEGWIRVATHILQTNGDFCTNRWCGTGSQWRVPLLLYLCPALPLIQAKVWLPVFNIRIMKASNLNSLE